MNDYKASPVGPIPKDWNVNELSKITKRIMVGIATEVKPYIREAGVPILRNQNIRDNFLDYSQLIYISPEFDVANKNKRVRVGDVVIVRTGSNLGQACVVPKEFDNAQTFTTLIVRPSEDLSSDFLSVHINSRGIKEVERLAAGGGKPNLNAGFLADYRLALPPIKEQIAIANLLSTWDKAINILSQLIAQKELRKKWLMQQLLTGKKRLKGFKGEWREVPLGEIFTEISETNDGDDLHSVMTISSRQGFISQTEKFDRIIAGDSLGKYTQLRRNDFAYNKGNSKSYPMGCIYQLEKHKTALVPFVYICFRSSKDIDSKFYKHWFLARGLDGQLKRIITSGARGDGLLNVNSRDFFQLKVPCPSREEQNAVADVMESADAELNLLALRLGKQKEQKKGLMQLLLTGKRRLKIK